MRTKKTPDLQQAGTANGKRGARALGMRALRKLGADDEALKIVAMFVEGLAKRSRASRRRN